MLFQSITFDKALLRRPRSLTPPKRVLSEKERAGKKITNKRAYDRRKEQHAAGLIKPALSRKCRTCDVTKPADAFYVEYGNNSLLSTKCRDCERKRLRLRERRVDHCVVCGVGFTVRNRRHTEGRPHCPECKKGLCKHERCGQPIHSAGKCLKHVVQARLQKSRGPGSYVSSADCAAIAAQFNGTCRYTGLPFTDADPMVIDHVVAVCWGGTSDPGNLVFCRRSFNILKGSLPPEDIDVLLKIYWERNELPGEPPKYVA